MKLPTLLLTALLGIAPLFAQEKDPIDRAMEAAMAKNSSTAGMVTAIDEAMKQWDQKLNTCYKALSKELPAAEWKELVTAQRAWIAFRDAQIKAMDATFDRMEGTMWIPIRAEMAMNLTRQRAQFLENMLHNVTLK
jgi:uncharacterized protein YecT (DUF1311 family)